MALMKEIKDRQEAFMGVFNAKDKDAAKAAAFYDEDCYFMPAGNEPISGKSAVEAHFKKDFGEGLGSVQLQTEEVNGAGDWAFERGAYKADGIFGPETGSYIIVWRKVGGAWLIHNDCFNIIKPHG